MDNYDIKYGSEIQFLNRIIEDGIEMDNIISMFNRRGIEIDIFAENFNEQLKKAYDKVLKQTS